MICRPFRTPKLMLPDRGLKTPGYNVFPLQGTVVDQIQHERITEDLLSILEPLQLIEKRFSKISRPDEFVLNPDGVLLLDSISMPKRVILDVQVFFRHSGGGRNPEEHQKLMDSAEKLHFVPGSPLRCARNDGNMEHFTLKNLIME